MAKKFIEGTELVQAGFANGISLQLAHKIETKYHDPVTAGEKGPAKLTQHEKDIFR